MAGNTPAVRFSLLGFPVRIETSFLILIALLGFGGSVRDLAVWVVVATFSVLGHELGHALAARRVGATATISLAGLAGLTHTTRAVPLSRRENAFVSAAGPGAGLLLGLLAFTAHATLGWESWTLGGWVLRLAIFTTAGWSVLNLLPILPLDGGHLLQVALPGSEEQRHRTAARVSIAVAGAGAFVAYRAGMQFAALFAFLLAAQNLAQLKHLAGASRLGDLESLYAAGRFDEAAERARQVAAEGRTGPADKVLARRYAVIALVQAGRHDEARDELDRSPEASELGKGFRGWVMSATGDAERGLALAGDAFDEEPGPDTALWLAQALLETGRYADAATLVEQHPGLLGFDVAQKAWATAFGAGDYTAAARIGDAAATRSDPGHAVLAYNAACSWARAGAEAPAFASLHTAVRLGWNDLASLDADDDLRPLRQSPEWAARRAALARAGGGDPETGHSA